MTQGGAGYLNSMINNPGELRLVLGGEEIVTGSDITVREMDRYLDGHVER